MRKTGLGLLAMTISLVLGTVISLGSMAAMRGHLETEALTSQPLAAPTVLVTCLSPASIGLEVAAIALIFRHRRGFGAEHERMSRLAVILYLVWAAANLLVFLPLSILGMMNGSRALVLAGQWVKATSALLAFAVPLLLVFGLSHRSQRAVLVLGLLLSAVGSFGSIASSIGTMELEEIDAGGIALHTPRWDVDYTSGLYPILLTAGHVGGFVYLGVYASLARRMWRASASVTAQRATTA
jgi:hypothetical protein